MPHAFEKQPGETYEQRWDRLNSHDGIPEQSWGTLLDVAVANRYAREPTKESRWARTTQA